MIPTRAGPGKPPIQWEPADTPAASDPTGAAVRARGHGQRSGRRQGGGTCVNRPDINLPCDPAPTMNIMSARSRHGGGVNVVFCDGSTRFVSDTIALAIWQALSTRRGNEPATLN